MVPTDGDYPVLRHRLPTGLPRPDPGTPRPPRHEWPDCHSSGIPRLWPPGRTGAVM